MLFAKMSSVSILDRIPLAAAAMIESIKDLLPGLRHPKGQLDWN
jgi:hypothetical protein